MPEELGGGGYDAGSAYIGVGLDLDPIDQGIFDIPAKFQAIKDVRIPVKVCPDLDHLQAEIKKIRLDCIPVELCIDDRKFESDLARLKKSVELTATVDLQSVEQKLESLTTQSRSIFYEAEVNLQSVQQKIDELSAQSQTIYYDAELRLDDSAAISKIDSFRETLEKTIRIDAEQKISIESNRLDSTISNQNGLFTKNLEKILKDANKESFLSRIGSVLTAPIRALGASFLEVGTGALRAVGEAAIKPFEQTISQKAKPITELVGKQSENVIKTGTVALARFSGYESTSQFRKETFGKIEELTDLNPRKIIKAYKKFEDNLVSILESVYIDKDSSAAVSKVKKYSQEIIERPLETLSELAGVGLRIGAQPFRIRKRVELSQTIKEAEMLVDDILSEMSDELKKQIKNAKGVTIATGGIDYQKGGENTYFSANLVRKLTPGNVTIPSPNSFSNDPSTLGALYQARRSIFPGAPMPIDRLLQTSVETGRNPDAARMLAQVMAVRRLAPESPITLTGSSGGAALVEEVIGAAERAAITKIKGVGLTLPGFDLTRTASKANYKTLVGTYDPISVAAFGNRFNDNSENFLETQSKTSAFSKFLTGFLSPGQATSVIPKAGLQHNLAKFLGRSVVQDQFSSFTGTGDIDPGYKKGERVFSFANELYKESQAIPRTIGVILGDLKALTEVAKGEYSFIDPGNPEYRRDNDFAAMTQNFEQLKVSGPDAAEYERFLKFLHDFKRELTSFYESGALQEGRIPKSLEDTAKRGQQFFKFREGAYQSDFSELKELDAVALTAKNKLTQYTNSLIKQSAFPQSKSDTFQGLVNQQLKQQTYDTQFKNKVFAEDRDRPVSPSSVVGANPLLENFQKFGRYLSSEVFRDFQQMIFQVNVAGKTYEFATPTFNDFRSTVKNTDSQLRSMYSSMKQLETLMVGDLANRYRQTLSSAAGESFNLASSYANTELTRGVNAFYNSLNAGINNAIENQDRYAAILDRTVTNFLVGTINTFQKLSAGEEAFFERFKALRIAKFALQAGAIAASPLALSAAGAGAAQGAEFALPAANFLQGAAELAGKIPLGGQEIQLGIEALRTGVIDYLTGVGANIAASGAGIVGAGAASIAAKPIEEKLKQFAAVRQNVAVLPGSTQKQLTQTVSTQDDFVKAIFEAKEASEIIKVLSENAVIPAKQLYKIARKLGSEIPARSSKAGVIEELENIAPELSKLQAATIQTYRQLHNVTREEREAITAQYEKFASTVRAERSALLASPLTDQEITEGLKEIATKINDFAVFVNVNKTQLNSLNRLKEVTLQESVNVSRPAQRVATQVIGPDDKPLRIEPKQVPINLQAKVERKKELEIPSFSTKTEIPLEQRDLYDLKSIKASNITIDAQVVNVNQRRSYVAEVPVSQLTLDPKRFQYKLSSNETGSTGSLSGVQKFDQNLAGVVQVWKDPSDGKDYVINGHNRVTLAKGLNVENLAVRYIDAETAKEARAIGAKTNIAEGRGTPLDAAKFFRDSNITSVDQLKQLGILLKESVATQGLGLANLAPELFNKTILGDIPVERGAIIGQGLSKAEDQRALVQLLDKELKRGKKINNDVLKELIDVVKSSATQVEQQTNLFGIEEVAKNLALEKAQLQVSVRRTLGKDSRLFGTVAKQNTASTLERGGNSINVEQSAQIAEQSTNALKVFDQLKDKTGEISQILNQGAQRLASGENIKIVEKDILKNVLSAVEKELSQFKKVGNQAGSFVQEGFAVGLEGNLAQNSAREMSEEVKITIDQEFENKSPSKWAYRVGRFVQEGLSLGLKPGKATLAALTLSNTVIETTEASFNGRFSSVGLNITKGIEAGIAKGKSGLVGEVKSLSADLVLASQAELEIRSPSGKTDKKIGRPFGEGILRGILATQEAIKQAAINVASGAIIAANEALKGQIKPDDFIEKRPKSLATADRLVLTNRPKFMAERPIEYFQDVVKNNPPILQPAVKANQDLYNSLNNVVRRNPPIFQRTQSLGAIPSPFNESDYVVPRKRPQEREFQGTLALPSSEIRAKAKNEDLREFYAGPKRPIKIISEFDDRTATQKAYESGEKVGRAVGLGVKEGVKFTEKTAKEVIDKIPENIKEKIVTIPDLFKGLFSGLKSQFNALQEELPLFAKITDGIKGIAVAAGVGFVGYQALDIFRQKIGESYQAVKQLQTTRISLDISTKGQGAETLALIDERAKAASGSIDQFRGNYVQFSAALRDTPNEAEIGRLSDAFSKTAVGLQLTPDLNERARTQITQIASKPQVNTEDLRTLSESLPGAFQLSARALGVTSGELSKLLETGQLTSEEFIKPFINVLNKEFSGSLINAAASIQGAENRLASVNRKFLELGEKGAPIAAAGLNTLAGILEFVTNNSEKLGLTIQLAALGGVALMGKAVAPLIGQMAALAIETLTYNGVIAVTTQGNVLLGASLANVGSGVLNLGKTLALGAIQFGAIALAAKFAMDTLTLFGDQSGNSGEGLKASTKALADYEKKLRDLGALGSKTSIKSPEEEIGKAAELKKQKVKPLFLDPIIEPILSLGAIGRQNAFDLVTKGDFQYTKRLEKTVEQRLENAKKQKGVTETLIKSTNAAVSQAGGDITDLNPQAYREATDAIVQEQSRLQTLLQSAESVSEKNIYENLIKSLDPLTQKFTKLEQPTLNLAKAFKELDSVNKEAESSIAKRESTTSDLRGQGSINDYQAQKQNINTIIEERQKQANSAEVAFKKLRDYLATPEYKKLASENKVDATADQNKLLDAEKNFYGKRQELGENLVKAREIEYSRRSELLQREVSEQERAQSKLEGLRRLTTTGRDASLSQAFAAQNITPQNLKLTQIDNTQADAKSAFEDQVKRRADALKNLKRAQQDLQRINPNDEQQYEQGKAAVAQYEQAVLAAGAEINNQRKAYFDAEKQRQDELLSLAGQVSDLAARKEELSVDRRIKAVERLNGILKRDSDNRIAAIERENKLISKQGEILTAQNNIVQVRGSGRVSGLKTAEDLARQIEEPQEETEESKKLKRDRLKGILGDLGVGFSEEKIFQRRVEAENQLAKTKEQALNLELNISAITLEREQKKEEIVRRSAITQAQAAERIARSNLDKSAISVQKAEIGLDLAKRSGDPLKVREAQLTLEQAQLDYSAAAGELPNATNAVNQALLDLAQSIKESELQKSLIKVQGDTKRTQFGLEERDRGLSTRIDAANKGFGKPTIRDASGLVSGLGLKNDPRQFSEGFTRNSTGVNTYAPDLRLLSRQGAISPVPLPKFDYASPGPDPGKAVDQFMGGFEKLFAPLTESVNLQKAMVQLLSMIQNKPVTQVTNKSEVKPVVYPNPFAGQR